MPPNTAPGSGSLVPWAIHSEPKQVGELRLPPARLPNKKNPRIHSLHGCGNCIDAMRKKLFRNLDRPVVVAVIAMRMMQTSVNQKIHVIAMWNGGMAAFRAVNVFGGAFGVGKTGRAFVGICGTDGNRVLVHMIAVRMMQMAVVKIIHMAVMFDGGVPATGAMDVGVIGVCRAGMLFAHRFVCFCVECSRLRPGQLNHHCSAGDKQCFCKRLALINGDIRLSP
jgi:hypothetical protein